jgi:hypothetical protein
VKEKWFEYHELSIPEKKDKKNKRKKKVRRRRRERKRRQKKKRIRVYAASEGKEAVRRKEGGGKELNLIANKSPRGRRRI